MMHAMMPCKQRTRLGQLLTAALGEVNWREIAEHYINDVEKEILNGNL